MPHLPVMQWDFMDRLAASVRQVTNGGASETTYYSYDAAGQRVYRLITATGRENALRTVFHRNRRVDPACRYSYDRRGMSRILVADAPAP
jgi:hypothetical protein